MCALNTFTHASCTQNDTMAWKSVMAVLSVSFAEPRFSCRQVCKMFTNLERTLTFIYGSSSHFEFSCICADLSAADLLADEEVHLVRIFWRVVCATGGGQSIPPSSPRLLVVTCQGLSQVPVSHKPAGISKTLAHTNINSAANKKRIWLNLIASPDIGLVYSHPKADGGYDDQHLPLHPLILDLCAISCLQTYSVKAEVKHLSPNLFVFSNPTTYMVEKKSNLHGKLWPRLQAW